MKVSKQKYKNRDGQSVESAKWYVRFKDHQELHRRLPGFTDKGATEELGRKIERLVSARAAGQPVAVDLSRWLETMPADLRTRLAKWGILDARAVSHSRPLAVHLDDFHASLLHKGCCEDHAETVTKRARRICEDSHFVFFADINASRVQRCLSDLRKGTTSKASIGHQTSNFYLAAMKQFCRWMVRDGRASESPVDHLSGLNVKLDRRHDRRSLSGDELTQLLKAAAAGSDYLRMNGKSRAMLYRVAMESGFRRKELAALTPASLEDQTDPPALVLAPINAKNRQPTVQVVRPELAKELREWIQTAGIAPDASLWPKLTRHTALLLRHDLEAAGIPYVDAAGLYADFHGLRHSFISLITKGGVHPKLAQRLARHSTVELTLARYSHTVLADEAQALEVLPSLPSIFDAPSTDQQTMRATGTDGNPTGHGSDAREKCLTHQLAKPTAKGLISVHQDASPAEPKTIPFASKSETRKARETRDKAAFPGLSNVSGGGGIRTPGGLPHTSFRD